MTPDSIERETTIEAPVERVWELLTQAAHVGRWFGDAGAEIDLREGGEMVVLWREHGSVRARIETVEPHTRFAYRWAPYKDPGGDEPVDWELDARRVHARARRRRHAPARRRDRLRFARDERGAARPQPRGQHRGLGRRARRAGACASRSACAGARPGPGDTRRRCRRPRARRAPGRESGCGRGARAARRSRSRRPAGETVAATRSWLPSAARRRAPGEHTPGLRL